MDKRYQIFISSTYSDLIEEREKVMRAVMELKYFPAGMEQFPAAGIPPIEMIKKFLKDCDYYILIIGARYGSINKQTGKSYTEEEYDFAVSEGIPVIAFLHKDPRSIPSGKTDENDGKRKKLKKFKEKVEDAGVTVRYWSNADNLKACVLASIPQAIQFQERTGWVRAGTEMSTDSREFDKLKNENARLKEQVKDNSQNSQDLKKSYQEAQSIIKDLKAKLENIHMTMKRPYRFSPNDQDFIDGNKH